MTPEQQAALDAANRRLAAQAAAQQRLAQPGPTGRPYVSPISGQPLVPMTGHPLQPPPPPTGPVGATHGVADPRMGQQDANQNIVEEERARRLLPGQLAAMAEGATFNLADEIAGLGGGIAGLLNPDISFREGFDQARGDVLEDLERARAEDPGGTMFAEMLGGMGLGAGAARTGVSFLRGATATVPSVAGRSALESSAYGLLYGLGGGENIEDRIEGGLQGAGIGAGTGLMFGLPTGMLLRTIMRRQSAAAGMPLDEINAAEIPDTHPLRIAVNDNYRAMRQAGVVLDNNSLNQLRTDLLAVSAGTRTPMTTETGGVWQVVDHINNNTFGNFQFGLEDLDVLRQIIRDSPTEGSGNQSFVARNMVRVIDDYIANLTPAQVASTNPGTSPQQAARLLLDAREANTRLMKANRITEAFYDATTTGGADPLANIRQQFRNLSHDNDFMRSLTQAERNTINLVAQEGNVEQFLRNVARMAPGSTLGLLDWRTLLAGGLAYQFSGGNPLWTAGAALAASATGGAAGAARNIMRTAAVNQAEAQFRGVPLKLGPAFGIPAVAGIGAAMPAEAALGEIWEERRRMGPNLPFAQ